MQVFYQVFKRVPSLVIGEVNKAIHLGVAGVSVKANSHAVQPAEVNFNMNIADGPNWTSAGFVGCLNNTLKYNPDRSMKVVPKGECSVNWHGGTLVKKKKIAAMKKAETTKKKKP